MPLYGYVAMLVQANLLISSALLGFGAQPCRLTTSFCANKSTYDVVEFSDKRGSKCPKKPPNSPFLLGIAEQSDLRGGSMSPRLFLQQNRARFGHLNFLHLARFLRCQRGLAYLAVLLLKSPHRAFLGLTRGYLRQKRRRLEWSLAALVLTANCDYHLATPPISVFILVGVFAFTTPIL